MDRFSLPIAPLAPQGNSNHQPQSPPCRMPTKREWEGDDTLEDMDRFYLPIAPLAPQGNSNHQPQSPPCGVPTKREWEDDDTQYESDPFELRLPENPKDGKQQSTAWLVKLPPYLTNHWKELVDFDDNEEIVLGALRVKVPKAPGDVSWLLYQIKLNQPKWAPNTSCVIRSKKYNLG